MVRTRKSARKLWLAVIILVIVLAVAVYVAIRTNQQNARSTNGSAVVFDFDAGSPSLSVNQTTPFNITINGLTASFSSPSDPAAFSVKNYDAESLKLSRFSGKYLYDNKSSRDILDIRFSSILVAAEFTFATVELQSEAVTVPSEILITGYKNTNLVGSNRTRGSFSSNSYPQGSVLFFTGMPFDRIRISIPATSATTDFLVDKIEVTPVTNSSK